MDDTRIDVVSASTRRAGVTALAGGRRGVASMLPFVGPALVASIAYMDPGNFATNIEAGARYGYRLLWVVLAANVVAMLFQSLSARFGIVTGRSLAAACRDHFPPRLVAAMWVASEVGAIATDLAELLGAAIGVTLLTGLPIMAALAVVGVATYLVLALQGGGFRAIEILVGGFVGVVGLCYLAQLFIVPVDWRALGLGLVVPGLDGPRSVALAVAIVGATVMPHAIYLHSSLTHDRVPTRTDAERARVVAYSDREVIVALGLAGLVNLAMVTMAAASFHDGVHDDITEIETAYRTLTPLMGPAAAGFFMVSLIASGFASSIVGTMAGQTIMQDFVAFQIPIWVRRLASLLPAAVVVGLGVGVTEALVWSQIVLSFVLPVPMIALLVLGGRADLMGAFATRGLMRAAAIVATVVVLVLNAALVAQGLGVPVPFMTDQAGTG